MRKILKAAIRIGGKVYTADKHLEAVDKARKDGKTVPSKGSQDEWDFKEKNGLFLASDGELLTRQETKEEFGFDHSEDIPRNKEKYVVVTEDFRTLGFALLEKEMKGKEVIFAVKPNEKEFKGKPKEIREGFDLQGKNIVPVFGLADVMERREKFRDYQFIWDNNIALEENELLRKEGFDVGLGGDLPFKLEHDRPFAIDTAKEYGIESPLWQDCKSKEEGVKFLKAHPDMDFVLKASDGDNGETIVLKGNDAKVNNEIMRKIVANSPFDKFVLQEKKPGIEVNVEIFFQDGKPMSASINLECKRILAGDGGKLTGCAMDVMKDIPLDSKLVKMTVGKMTPFYKGYTGLADINCLIGERDSDIWFLENCNRIGINAHVNYFMNIENKGFLRTIGDLSKKQYKPDINHVWGASLTCYAPKQRKGIPITIPDDMKDKVFLFDGYKENKDDDTILETGYGDDLLVICDKDFDIETAQQKVFDLAERLVIPNLGYRNDGMKKDSPLSMLKRYIQLQQMGYI